MSRDCINVPKGDPETSDGCHDQLSTKEATDKATSFLSTIGLADIEWTGSACYGGEFYRKTGSGSRSGGASVVILASLGFIAPRLF